MSDKAFVGKSMAFKIIQNNGEFYVTPLPISLASEILSINTANWDNQKSKFFGINREVIKKHKMDILAALQNRSIILPNSIIAYIQHDYFKFTESPGMKTDFYNLGEVTFYKSNTKDPESKTAVILDGQHRFTALSDFNRGKGEDFPLYVVFFHEPNPLDKKGEEFEKLCLNVMSQVNKSVRLSESEEKLIIARTREVASNAKIKEFITLVVNELDADAKCPLKYQVRNKKPANKRRQWLKLSVWVNALTNSFNDRHNPRILRPVWDVATFSTGTLNNSSWEVKICVDMIKHGLKAVYGLASQYWEQKTTNQRLYHNIGIRSLISIIDIANANEELFSTDPQRQFCKKQPDSIKLIKKLQIALYPITALDWSANKKGKPGMINVKQQQEIDKNFSANLCQLINEFFERRKEWDQNKNTDAFKFNFLVNDSNHQQIYQQSIEISHSEFVNTKKSIENGDLMKDYILPTALLKKTKDKIGGKRKKKK